MLVLPSSDDLQYFVSFSTSALVSILNLVLISTRIAAKVEILPTKPPPDSITPWNVSSTIRVLNHLVYHLAFTALHRWFPGTFEPGNPSNQTVKQVHQKSNDQDPSHVNPAFKGMSSWPSASRLSRRSPTARPRPG